ncbi:MAG: DegV family protein, partial [Oscillospiraceae bacterium]
TCDLSYLQEDKYGVRVINCLVEMDGLPYEERVDVNAAQVYEYVEKTGNMPHHAQITVIRFVEEYMKAARDGYENIICVTMNREGSGTYSSACYATEMLTSEYPALEGKLNIRVVDSGTYSVGIDMGV